MKKTIVLLLTVVLVFVSVLSAKSAPLPTSMIPGNAQWIVHLDMKQFNATQLSDLLKKSYMDKFDTYIQKLSTEYKFDLLNDTTGITVFGTEKSKNNFVVCWAGNFDKTHLISLLEKAITHERLKYGKFTIHKWQYAQFGAFVNDHTLMWSMNEQAIKNALDAFTGKKKNIGDSPMMSYMKGIPGDAFLKAAANNIASLAKDREASMILKNTGMALFIAMERNDNLKLNLRLTTDTPETAKNIEQIVNGFISLAKMKQEDKDPRWKILDHLKTNLKGNVLQFDLSYPSQDLIAMLAHTRGHKRGHKKHMHDEEK